MDYLFDSVPVGCKMLIIFSSLRVFLSFTRDIMWNMNSNALSFYILAICDENMTKTFFC